MAGQSIVHYLSVFQGDGSCSFARGSRGKPREKNMEERAKALAALAAQRWRIALSLTGAMMFVYFGFILLIAFNKPLMGAIVVPGLSLGVLLGALVIVSAWVLIYIYVRWANNSYDEKIAQLLNR